MPHEKFESLQTESQLIKFFEETFADAVVLMGLDMLVKEYFKNPKGSLVSIKVSKVWSDMCRLSLLTLSHQCAPYHYRDRCVIIGDAAHAMVPFYGQGMNCGFEDVQVLDRIISAHVPPGIVPTTLTLSAALQSYSATRHPDVTKMNDLAMHNYIEMRSSVTKLSYKLRKKIEGAAHRLFPNKVIPLYTMVSFTNIPYSQVVQRWERQSRWLNALAYTFGISTVAGAGYGLAKYTGFKWCRHVRPKEEEILVVSIRNNSSLMRAWEAVDGAFRATAESEYVRTGLGWSTSAWNGLGKGLEMIGLR